MLAHTILLVFGLYFMACGAGLLANPDRMARLIDELEDSPAIGFLCGAVMIFAAGNLVSPEQFLHRNRWHRNPDHRRGARRRSPPGGMAQTTLGIGTLDDAG